MTLVIYFYITIHIYSATSVNVMPSSVYHISSQPKLKTIFNELPWPMKLKLLDPATPTRRVGIQSLVIRPQESNISTVISSRNEDDADMRIKLFRLMYETVRDSDLKVKRAELIQSHYANSSVFEIGFLMGDVQDRFNVMNDLAKALERLYHDWKPIEHINAYEQMANHAVEVNHVVDMMISIAKKNEEKTVDKGKHI